MQTKSSINCTIEQINSIAEIIRAEKILIKLNQEARKVDTEPSVACWVFLYRGRISFQKIEFLSKRQRV